MTQPLDKTNVNIGLVSQNVIRRLILPFPATRFCDHAYDDFTL